MAEFAYSSVPSANTVAFDYPLDNAANTPKKGEFVTLVNGKMQKALPATATIAGFNEGGYFAGLKEPMTTCKVRTHADNVYRIPYVGTTKTSLTDTDIGTAFDLNADHKLNLDATAVGQLRVVSYNNQRKIALVKIDKKQEL